MKTRSLHLALIALASASLSMACSASDSNSQPEDSFSEAIPDAQMLRLSLSDSSATQSAKTGTAQQAVVGQEASLHQDASEFVTNVNNTLHSTHQLLDQIILLIPSVPFTYRGMSCHKWEFDGDDQIHWRLVSCEKDPASRRYSFLLQGRATSSATEESYKAIIAGESTSLARFEGARRGHGHIGYDFDNLNALKPQNIHGKLGIGYRAAGRVRQLNVAIKDWTDNPSQTAGSALYRYGDVKDTGGFFKMLYDVDFLSRDGTGQLIDGQDGLNEIGRATVVWREGAGARAAAMTCGGTLGELCVGLNQCWNAGGIVTWEEYALNSQPQHWDPSACKDNPPFAAEPPSEKEMTLPSQVDEDSKAPIPEEPSASDKE